MTHYVLFTVAGTTYGLPSQDVRHIEMVEQVTRVPNAPPFVDGAVFSRGQVVPAVNLRVRFGFDRAPYDPATRLLVVQAGERTVGLVADAGREFVAIPESAVQPPHEGLSGATARYVTAIARLGDRLVFILDLRELMAVTDTASVA